MLTLSKAHRIARADKEDAIDGQIITNELIAQAQARIQRFNDTKARLKAERVERHIRNSGKAMFFKTNKPHNEIYLGYNPVKKKRFKKTA